MADNEELKTPEDKTQEEKVNPPQFLSDIDKSLFGGVSSARPMTQEEHDLMPKLDQQAESTISQPQQTQPIQPQQPSNEYNYGVNTLAGLSDIAQGQQKSYEALAKQGSEQEQAAKEYADQARRSQEQYKAAMDPINKNIADTESWIAQHPENANRYLQNMSTGEKIGTTIGLLLGGMGSGLTGGPNLAAKYLDNQIERDIASQKQDVANKNSLLNHYRQQGLNERESMEMANLTNRKILDASLAQAAGRAQTAQAKASILQVQGLNKQKMDEIMQNISINRMKTGGGPAGSDPAKMVALLVPKEHQKKAFEEIEAAENTNKSASEIMKSFDNAANTINAADFVPGMQNRYQKSLHALLGPTFKDVEGTVRQAAMDNLFANITPQFGDNAATIKAKKDALQGYLQSKQSAPTARAYGVDLSKFKSTAPGNPQSTERKLYKGKWYVRGPNGEAIPE